MQQIHEHWLHITQDSLRVYVIACVMLNSTQLDVELSKGSQREQLSPINERSDPVDSVYRSWRHKQKHDWLGCTLFNWVSWVELSCVAIHTPLSSSPNDQSTFLDLSAALIAACRLPASSMLSLLWLISGGPRIGINDSADTRSHSSSPSALLPWCTRHFLELKLINNV